MPNTIPIPILMTNGSTMLMGVMTVGIPAKSVIKIGINIPTPRPTTQPIVESTTVSMRN